MSDEIWSRDEPESPCIRVCVIHPESGLCVGCFRRRDEIAGWGAMSAEARRALIEELPAREGQLTKRRGGRKRRSAPVE